MKRLTAIGLAAFFGIVSAAPALPAFTTAPKTANPRGDAAELYGAAAGCHKAFDRFVIRAHFATPG